MFEPGVICRRIDEFRASKLPYPPEPFNGLCIYYRSLGLADSDIAVNRVFDEASRLLGQLSLQRFRGSQLVNFSFTLSKKSLFYPSRRYSFNTELSLANGPR